jgi:hypothetical protein
LRRLRGDLDPRPAREPLGAVVCLSRSRSAQSDGSRGPPDPKRREHAAEGEATERRRGGQGRGGGGSPERRTISLSYGRCERCDGGGGGRVRVAGLGSSVVMIIIQGSSVVVVTPRAVPARRSIIVLVDSPTTFVTSPPPPTHSDAESCDTPSPRLAVGRALIAQTSARVVPSRSRRDVSRRPASWMSAAACDERNASSRDR